MTAGTLDGGPVLEMGNMDGSENIDCTIWIDDIKIEVSSTD